MTDSPTPKPRKKRKPSEIPPSELRKRLVNQGRHAAIIDFIIETRIAKARKKQSEGGIKGLRIRRAPEFKPLQANLAHLNKQIRERIAYIKRTAESDPSEAKTAIAFLHICLAQAMHARDTLKHHAQLGRGAPSRWQELITPEQHAQRTGAYRVMSGRMQDRLARIERAMAE
jgi:hypothetical protein